MQSSSSRLDVSSHSSLYKLKIKDSIKKDKYYITAICFYNSFISNVSCTNEDCRPCTEKKINSLGKVFRNIIQIRLHISNRQIRLLASSCDSKSINFCFDVGSLETGTIPAGEWRTDSQGSVNLHITPNVPGILEQRV